MADISQGNRAELILNPGDVYRVSTGGSATVEAVYGAPTGTTTVTASTQDFGPYYANAKLIVRAVSGPASYSINQAVPIVARNGSLDDASKQVLQCSGFVWSTTLAAMDRPWPINNASSGNGVPGNRTTHIKRSAEAPFSRVRLWIMRRSDTASSVTVGAFSARVAVTETAADTNSDTRYRPIIGGAVQNVPADVSNIAGWRTVTFGGAGTVSIPGDTNVGLPIWVVSDWIDLRSIPRADGGTRPLALARVYFDATSGGSSVFSNFSSWNTNAAGQDYYREYFVENYAGDAIGTLSNNPAGTQNGTGLGLAVHMEFDYDAPVRSFYGAGDSLIASPHVASNGTFDTWLMRAVNAKSTPAAPMVYTNGGISSRVSHEYINALIQHITLGGRPTDVVLLVGSGNDDPAKGSAGFAYTDWQNASVQSLVMRAIAACSSIRARVYLVTITPRALALATDNRRKALNTWTRALCATGAATLVDADALLSDGATPARMRPEYNGGDTIHYSAAATALLASEMRRVIA